MTSLQQHMSRFQQRILVMTAIFMASFMTSVEVTIVTTALPQIISELHGLAFQSWIMSAYLFTTAISTPICGKLADSLGRKPVFQWGVILFTLGSLGSGLAGNIGWLIGARLVQGLGAGAIMPLTFTIIADYFSFEKRAQILALNNTAWALSSLIGPLLGGFLVDKLSWHWVFFVNIPLGILVFGLMGLGYVQKQATSQNLTIDWSGIGLLTLGLLCLLIAVQTLSTYFWPAVGLFLIGLVLLLLLAKWEHQVADPLIEPQMFSNKTFTIQVVTIMLFSGVLISYQVYFPIWLQSIYHLPASMAGMVVSSSSVMWLVGSFLVGRLMTRFVPKRVVLLIAVLELVFYSSLLFASTAFPVWMFYLIAGVNGLGLGIVISMNTILAQHLVRPNLVGEASGMITLGRSLGQTIMTGIYGAVFNIVLVNNRGPISLSTLNRAVSASNYHQFKNQLAINLVVLQGLHAVFLVVAILLLLILIINFLDPNHKIIK